jgi:hypothetical protein
MSKEKSSAPRFVAKRKYWIEWECLFDAHPSKKDLEVTNDKLIKYIENYLENWFNRKPYGNDSSGKSVPVQSVPSAIQDDINDFFHGSPDSKSMSDTEDQVHEYHKWDEGTDKWKEIQSVEYGQIVDANSKLPVEQKRIALKYSVSTKKWIKLLKTEWLEVSGSQSVFSYRGWFEGKNHLRLSTSGTENKGTMNPPPPPPPPAS